MRNKHKLLSKIDVAYFLPRDALVHSAVVTTDHVIMTDNVITFITDSVTRCHAVAGTTARCALYNECTNPNPATNLIPVRNLQ